MAIRSVAQLKAWFKRGKYPTESQFTDWIDSFFHKKEDEIPIGSVDKLPEQLNGKYPNSDGRELEKKHDLLRLDFNTHKIASEKEFDNIHTNLEELEAEDVKIWSDIATIHQDVTDLQAEDVKIWEDNAELHKTDETLQASLTNAHTDLGTIREMMKAGATFAEAKAALLALGANYKDLYAVAGTLKAFLEANDTIDTTINTWTEIEKFLQGITDSQSLTTLLNALETKITTAYNAAIAAAVKVETDRAEAAETNSAAQVVKLVESVSELSSIATHTKPGLMSAEDKTKLDGTVMGDDKFYLPFPASSDLTYSDMDTGTISYLVGGIEGFNSMVEASNAGKRLYLAQSYPNEECQALYHFASPGYFCCTYIQPSGVISNMLVVLVVTIVIILTNSTFKNYAHMASLQNIRA